MFHFPSRVGESKNLCKICQLIENYDAVDIEVSAFHDSHALLCACVCQRAFDIVV